MPGACLQGPAWIGEDCRIGPGCWIRENTVVGRGAILGNSCELKNCVIGDGAEVPHWNYVGDSILGWKAHLGAGVVLSNWRHDHGAVPVLDERGPGGRVATGLAKFGAVLGDFADIGAHAVLNPGSMIGRGSVLYPGTVWRGVLAGGMLVKVRQEQVVVERR
jgi:NDP-sugar pyrophosphorylase family protein